MAAALYGDAALVRELLDAGADPNVANDAARRR
jgi:ankyrin repeat protein